MVAVTKIDRVDPARVSEVMEQIEPHRAVLDGIQLGIMQACLDVVVPYVRERQQFGTPIGHFQLMQAKVADMFRQYTVERGAE